MRQDPVIETEIILDSEILFGTEANGTDIADHLDRVNFGSQFSSNLTTPAVCNMSALPQEYPPGNGSFLSLLDKSITINTQSGDKMVPSGLFAYYKCSDDTKYINMTRNISRMMIIMTTRAPTLAPTAMGTMSEVLASAGQETPAK